MSPVKVLMNSSDLLKGYVERLWTLIILHIVSLSLNDLSLEKIWIVTAWFDELMASPTSLEWITTVLNIIAAHATTSFSNLYIDINSKCHCKVNRSYD